MSEETLACSSAREDRTLRFLQEAATAYALLAPATSRSLARRLRSAASLAKVDLHPSVEQSICPSCSQVYVPGSNCHVTVERRRKKRGRKSRRLQRDAKSRSKLLPRPTAVAAGELAGPHAPHSSSRIASARANDRSSAKSNSCMRYRCRFCNHGRRITLPPRPRKIKRTVAPLASSQQVSADKTVRSQQENPTAAQKQRGAAWEEARNARNAAKRFKKAAAAKAEKKEETNSSEAVRTGDATPARVPDVQSVSMDTSDATLHEEARSPGVLAAQTPEAPIAKAPATLGPAKSPVTTTADSGVSAAETPEAPIAKAPIAKAPAKVSAPAPLLPAKAPVVTTATSGVSTASTPEAPIAKRPVCKPLVKDPAPAAIAPASAEGDEQQQRKRKRCKDKMSRALDATAPLPRPPSKGLLDF